MISQQPDLVAKVTLRARLITTMVLLAGLALLTSGAIVAVLQHRAIHSGVDDQLTRTRDELRVLATEGIDPATGQSFAGPSELLHTFLARTVIGEAEGELAVVDGQVRWVASTDVPLRPENDEELVGHLMPMAAGNQIRIDTVRTPDGNYRVLVAPVQYPGSTGALVHVYDLDLVEAELRRTMTLYAVVAVGTVLLLVLVAWISVGRLLRPIEELRKAAESIDERDLTSRVPVRGRDDLTALSSTINRMLDRVQRSVEGQRQLLDDVGHELRTPITVVRGHMELVDPDDPVDVRETRDLVIDEADRMGVLVNDMLMLAKATESDFVQPRWFDVATLTDQVLEKARALGDRAWRLERIASAEAFLDPGRMTQAWLQLAANAVKYSDAGSAITLGSALERGEVLLWVRDEGIGIEPDQLDVVRQRFGRSRVGAAHAQGAGLGLSIVESIMAAHGGRLDIESTVGVGSRFTLVLPLGPVEPAELEPTIKMESL
ncbi:HAMP domain-containing histidine kinase [Tessaracoccus sp. MC1865]|uniref:sensor histidine kinase n=1 Tax=Tessaracoccus sp. MC1865 TaxID=2760310 RepID=UPI00160256F5|nr:HAMP domain-containing sensor histidine kinase [Tessaracoccus sp. MC1865]MBB1482943.1 HAMP domain-containing histidine kinase [Tessaracoccus sp. MC1865]QTO37619.1 HAMP domain-containing histidine kinase [Tessaracoccus sp. MC1865]